MNKASFIIASRKAIEWLAQSSCLNAGISNIPLRGVFDYTFSLYPLQVPHRVPMITVVLTLVLFLTHRWYYWQLLSSVQNDLYQLTLYLILLFLCLKFYHKSLVFIGLTAKGLAWQAFFYILVQELFFSFIFPVVKMETLVSIFFHSAEYTKHTQTHTDTHRHTHTSLVCASY